MAVMVVVTNVPLKSEQIVAEYETLVSAPQMSLQQREHDARLVRVGDVQQSFFL
jgi:hypothetical protein